MDPKSQQIKHEVLEKLIEFMEGMDVERLRSHGQPEQQLEEAVPEEAVSEESEEGAPVMEDQPSPESNEDAELLAELEAQYGKLKG